MDRSYVWARVQLLGAVLLLLSSAQVHAVTSAQLEAGAVFRQIKERDAGQTLVKEQGLGAGLSASVQQRMANWRVGARAQWLQSRLDYDGQSQVGAALGSKTDWTEASAGLGFGRHFAGRTGPYVGGRIEYQWRKREIQASGRVAGLEERYRSIWAGLEVSSAPFRTTTVSLQLGCAVHSSVDVDFGAGFDTTALSVQDHCRAQLDAQIGVGSLRGQRLFVRPFVTWERYPNTDWEPLTAAGNPAGRVYLPRTEFATFGINIGIGRRLR